MPRLWSDTIGTHRQAVRDATLDATAGLVAAVGLRSVTMARIAEQTGISRATLYKYFSDVEAILMAWHERQVLVDLQQLTELRDRRGPPAARLESVLQTYALIQREQPDGHMTALLHEGTHVAGAHEHLEKLVRDLLTEAALEGEVRDDVAPAELTSYGLSALGSAGTLPSKAAVRRLVAVTLAGLRPQS